MSEPMRKREAVAWTLTTLGAVLTLLITFGGYQLFLDARYAFKDALAASLEIMLSEVENDRSADIYWLQKKKELEGLTPTEEGRLGSQKMGLRRLERMQESLNE